MENDAYNNFTKKYCPQFSKIAVDMGFVTEKQLAEAVAQQAEDSLSNRPYRPIGSIFFDNGWINNEQIDIIFDILFKVPV